MRHLRYFLAVSEELHFGRAAARLHMAQPPLSQAVRKLEAELGVKLLNRTSRVVTLTPAGLRFAEEARNVLSSFDRAVVEARRAGGAGKVLRVGSVNFLPVVKLMAFLTAFGQRLPEWETVVTHMRALEQVRALRAGELDVGIFLPAEDYDALQLVPLFPGEPLVAYLAPTDPLASKEVIRPQDVSDSTLVLFSRVTNPAAHDLLRTWLDESGYHFGRIYETVGTDFRDLLVAAAAGAGVSIAPASFGEAGQLGDAVVHRRLEPALTGPDTVLALLQDPPAELAETVSALQEIAAALRGTPAASGFAA